MIIGQHRIPLIIGSATATTVDSALDEYVYYLKSTGKARSAYKFIKYGFIKVMKIKMV